MLCTAKEEDKILCVLKYTQQLNKAFKLFLNARKRRVSWIWNICVYHFQSMMMPQFENKTAVVYQILSPKTIYGVQKNMHLHLLLL